ncbi:unnamed protein product [Pleuronectes platessa]|uniref:Uncharacterized protein n=1 Tax=Pleuronectes platessa TaxID=8262 RepID=A0A9N7VQJ2_PLEPL|nr:unnamed protein product [Pleuronectes platessa]
MKSSCSRDNPEYPMFSSSGATFMQGLVFYGLKHFTHPSIGMVSLRKANTRPPIMPTPYRGNIKTILMTCITACMGTASLRPQSPVSSDQLADRIPRDDLKKGQQWSRLSVETGLEVACPITAPARSTGNWAGISDPFCSNSQWMWYLIWSVRSLGGTVDPPCRSNPTVNNPEQCLVSGRLRSIRTKTARHKSNFFPAAVGLINKARDPYLTLNFIPPHTSRMC